MIGVGGGFASLRVDRLPYIGVDKGPSRDEIDLVRATLQYPEDGVAAGVDQALDRLPVLLQIDQHRRLDLVPVPGIVLVVLVIGLDLAGIRIERQNRTGVEIVARMQVAGPWRGVSHSPINEV